MTIAKLVIPPVDTGFVLKDRIYDSLKQAISAMNVYADNDEHRLDERQLSEELGVSRTPVREALCRLEQEGFVRMIPRRGAFVVRKSKREVIEMVTVWAALESMAARLATQHASDDEIAGLRRMFTTFEDAQPQAHIDEYSEKNIEFHQTILRLGRCHLIHQMTANLFIHMRGIRARTIGEDDRAKRSIIDHMNIIEALEQRNADEAERLVREHTLKLAEHIEKHVEYLD
jgi:DNA-binding GntR family transcriptional regulator